MNVISETSASKTLAAKKPLKTVLVAGICIGVAAASVVLFLSVLSRPEYGVDVDAVQSGLAIKFIKVTNSGYGS